MRQIGSAATLVVIPARGGSKGIVGKNLVALGGRPLLTWTVAQALAIQTEPVVVVVSTEDPTIAEVAQQAGARVVSRPAKLASDTTPTEPVVNQVIDSLAADGHQFAQVMLLQATSPIRLPGTLDRALVQFRQTQLDSLVGVVTSSPFLWHLSAEHPAEAWVGQPSYNYAARPRRQDLRPEQVPYRETGSLYITKTDLYQAHHNRLGGRIGLFVMDPIEGIDIDEPADLTLAESQLRQVQADRPEFSQPGGAQ